MENKRFIVRREHLKLLQHTYVEWNPTETGAPSINPKKPYGNSDVINDIYEILDPEGSKEGRELTEEEEGSLEGLHKETQTVLQIVLKTGRFLPGIYEKTGYDEWKFIGFTEAYNDDLRKTISSAPSFIMLAGHLRRSYGLYNIKLENYYSPETLIANALYYFLGKLNEVMIPVDLGFRDKVQEIKNKEFNEFT